MCHQQTHQSALASLDAFISIVESITSFSLCLAFIHIEQVVQNSIYAYVSSVMHSDICCSLVTWIKNDHLLDNTWFFDDIKNCAKAL